MQFTGCNIEFSIRKVNYNFDTIMIPQLIKGDRHEDGRGSLRYNNEFNSEVIKRFYIIENADPDFIRAWRGHQIEERWFAAINGSFKIQLIAIDNWELPCKKLGRLTFNLQSSTLDVLHIPSGYITSIQAVEKNSKLLVMANYSVGEIEDEYRFAADYFE